MEIVVEPPLEVLNCETQHLIFESATGKAVSPLTRQQAVIGWIGTQALGDVCRNDLQNQTDTNEAPFSKDMLLQRPRGVGRTEPN